MMPLNYATSVATFSLSGGVTCAVLDLWQSAGELFITVNFMPFDKPQFDDDVEMKPLKTGIVCNRGQC